MLPIIDIILTVAVSGFVFYGLFFGLIRTFGVFAGVLIGALLASRFYVPVAEWIQPFFFGYNNLGKVLVFIVLFSLINRLVGFGFYLLDKAFNIISIIPFLKTFNRIGGAVLGFISGSLFIGLILFVISKYAIINTLFGGWLIDSKLSPFFLKMNTILLPLLPEMLKKLKSMIEWSI
ncbi:CvpA family protein [bacterium]|nr:CvpA family protein [bacterium]